jgi:ParB-like chromosome segregation protein Spo0J
MSTAMRVVNVPQTTMVYLKDIKRYPHLLQTRAETNLKIVSIYSKRMKTTDFEPILLYRLPSGELVLADGFHRYEAAKMLRREKIACTIVEGTMEEAILAGMAANAALEDRTLTAEDKAHAIKLLLRNEEFNSWSDNGLAVIVGRGVHAVSATRLALRDSEGIALPERVKIIKDGRWTGGTRKYKKDKSAPSASQSKNGQNHISIDGNVICGSRDPAKFQAEVSERLEARAATNSQLTSIHKFASFLKTNGILARNLGYGIRFPVLLLSHAFVSCMPFDGLTGRVDFQQFKAACLDVLAARAIYPENRRCVIVGHFGGQNPIRCLVPALTALGLELMTPEELIAEFGPKDGEPISSAEPLPDSP